VRIAERDAPVAEQPLPFARAGTVETNFYWRMQRRVEQIDAQIGLHRQHHIEAALAKQPVKSAVIRP